MQIIINYESKWGNSFLSEPNDKGERKYIASKKASKNKSDTEKNISLDTVYGILYRLLGSRKPLKIILKEDNSIMKKLIEENKINFNVSKKIQTKELVYIRNKNNHEISYSGVPNENLLKIKDIKKPLSVLFYNRDELLEYILSNKPYDLKLKEETKSISILEISKMLSDFGKNKDLKLNNNEYKSLNKSYKNIFKQDIHPESACLTFLAINKSIHYFFKNKTEKLIKLSNNNTFAGISLNGHSYTEKTFMQQFANKKINYGNQYKIKKENGVLKINIDCDLESAEEIKVLLNNAGVSSFYLGKKGLAYVDEIII